VKICFECQWGQSPAELLNKYRKQTPNNSANWKDLRGVSNPSDADFIVALGNRPFNHRANSHKVIQVRREPNFIEGFFPTTNAHHIIDYDEGGYHVATWFVEKDFNELSTMPYFPKRKKISAISSSKWQHRNIFLKRVCDLTKEGTVDFYGRGLGNILRSPDYKGVLNQNKNCKFHGLHDYSYSIAIENSSQKYYFTEKIIDCFLTWTMPIYWGCPNISEFFPENSYYVIDLARPEDIKEIIKKPIEKKHIDALKEARNLVLYKYNIWPTIERIIA